MYKVFVSNGLSKWNEDYSNCHICSDLVIDGGEDETLKHIIDPHHRELLESVDYSKFPQIAKLTEIECHQLVQNNISIKEKSLFCNLCCCDILDFKVVQEHLEHKYHKENLKVDFKKLIKNGIYFKFKYYMCKPCNRKFLYIQAAFNHLVSKIHQEKTKKRTLDVEEEHHKANKISNTKNVNTNTQNVNMMILEDNEIEEDSIRSNRKCKACTCIIPFDTVSKHITQDSHILNLHRMKINDNLYEINLNPILIEYFYCRKCDLWIEKDETLLQCHCMLHFYQLLPNFQHDIIKCDFENNKTDIKCLICDYKINSDIHLALHVQTLGHLQKLQNNFLIGNRKKVKSLTSEEWDNICKVIDKRHCTFNAMENLLICSKCNCLIPKKNDNGHFYDFEQKPLDDSHSKDHVKNEYTRKLNKYFKCYKCFLCDKSLPSERSVMRHYLNDVGHSYRYQNLYKLKHPNISKELNHGESKEYGKLENSLNEEFACDEKVAELINKTILSNPKNIKPVESETEQSPSYNNNKTIVNSNPIVEYFYCKICMIYIPREKTSYIQNHCMYHLYKDYPDLHNDFIEFGLEGKNFVIKCLICNRTMCHYNQLRRHFSKKIHNENIKLFRKRNNYENNKKNWKMFPESESLDTFGFHPKTDFSLASICGMCHIPETDSDDFIYTIEYDCIPGHNHESEDDTLSQTIPSDVKIDFYKCYMCNASCTNKETLFDHYKTDQHMDKKKVLNLKFKDPAECKKSEQQSENAKKLVEKIDQSLVLNDDIDDASSSINDEEDEDDKEVEEVDESASIKKYPLERREVTREKGVLYPYNLDLAQYGSMFVEMCIQPGERNIFAFDPKDIDLMKFGASVMFPSKSNQCICLACDYEIPLEPPDLFEHLQHETHIENLLDMKNCEQDDGAMSYLDLAKDSLIETSEGEIRCVACEQRIENSLKNLKIHISRQNSHKKKLNLCKEKMQITSDKLFQLLDEFWYHANFFYCVICKIEIYGELNFVRHLDRPTHQVIAQLGNKNCKVNKCLTCCSVWCGTTSYSEHCNDYFHNLPKNRRSLQPPKLDKTSARKLNDIMDVDRVTKALIHESDKVERSEMYREGQLLQDIQFTVQPLYPKAQAFKFGSRSSRLGLFKSDLDVFLDLENIYYLKGSKTASQRYIRSICKEIFINNKRIWKKDKVLLSPRVPIIKLEHRPTQLKCDLSFMNGLGVEKSHLIKKYVTAYKGCRELILYLKKWFDAIKLYGPSAFNAYAITWLTIFYLQTLGIFPSVDELRFKSNKVDGWECNFTKKIIVGNNASNYTFKDLLKGFFSYYADFDYHTCIVSPLTGKIFKKCDFLHIEKMPIEVNIYKERLKKEELEYFRYNSPMCLQDPVDLSQNITKSVKKRDLKIFRQYCRKNC